MEHAVELWCDRQELRRWARHPEDEVDDSDEWDDGSSGSSESEDFDTECDEAVRTVLGEVSLGRMSMANNR